MTAPHVWFFKMIDPILDELVLLVAAVGVLLIVAGIAHLIALCRNGDKQ